MIKEAMVERKVICCDICGDVCTGKVDVRRFIPSNVGTGKIWIDCCWRCFDAIILPVIEEKTSVKFQREGPGGGTTLL